MSRSRTERFPRPTAEGAGEPFERAEEAWLWFILAQQARNDGARITAGAGMVARPCEPADILAVLNRLHRNRRLMMEHLLVLRHYGRRQTPPDPRRVKEVRAFHLWKEALERIEPILVRKGIVRARITRTEHPTKFWSHAAVVHETRPAPLPLGSFL